ncbi:efflux transporter outer membrane subunit [Pseudoxanthomonas sp.]|uniref:efflux transporter outer membrane subunit n=1 Tax=Pseudoxanthomonas sp. TaxID=1871049 RepID=UPI00262913F0|nr:efflux transporter outer membrane subunit [Pseudoxanthomonas sp.]WDS34974.1 MAG: efflux transporter outer membrane subunit [Pseudoxanthomonas sp.]
MRKALLVAGIALLPASLAGCVSGPDFRAPTPALPAAWSFERADDVPGQLEQAPIQAAPAWWQRFGDPLLVSLVQRAVESNLDLQIADVRLTQSRAVRGSTAADRSPAVSAGASAMRARNSQVGLSDPSGHAGLDDYGLYQGGLSLSWELDLWGRVRRQVEAADAQIAMARADRQGAALAVMAETAQDYLQLRGVQALTAITQDNLVSAQAGLDLTHVRLGEGVATQLEVASAAAQVAAIQARIPALEQQQASLINALSVMLAQSPRALATELRQARPVPAGPINVPVGLPSELAQRRPDIVRAEAALHAATANIGLAKASFYPRISLSGDAGYQAQQLSSMGDWGARRFGIGPVLSLPLFDGGRLRANLRLSTLRQEEAALQYQKTVLLAWSEVDDAVSAYRTQQRRQQYLREAVNQSRIALDSAQKQYKAGTVDMLNVLTMQQSMLNNEAALADSTTAVSVAMVSLYRALGQGWG